MGKGCTGVDGKVPPTMKPSRDSGMGPPPERGRKQGNSGRERNQRWEVTRLGDVPLQHNGESLGETAGRAAVTWGLL